MRALSPAVPGANLPVTGHIILLDECFCLVASEALLPHTHKQLSRMKSYDVIPQAVLAFGVLALIRRTLGTKGVWSKQTS